jgi:hypothetical protein
MFDWNELENRRRVWAPNTPAENSEVCQAVETISRGFALTDLEPQVALFIKEGLDLADAAKIAPAKRTLLRNIEDEVKHEIALNAARKATSNYDPQYEAEAKEIMDAWKSLPDSPIVTTAVLETAVFQPLLVLYARFGGISLRVTALDISGDERLHSISHRQAAMMLGTKPSKKLNNLRIDTVAWLAKDLNEGGFDQARLLKNSELLQRRGISDMIETRANSVYAIMEMPTTSLSAYAER